MLQIVKKTIEIDVDENDLITIDEAARETGRTITAIVAMMDRGRLPWYQMMPVGSVQRKRIPKYTSRQAVFALPKEKSRSVSSTRKPSAAKQ